MLLIKAQWPKRDHLLAGARTASFCSVSVQPAQPLVDFNAPKCSNRDLSSTHSTKGLLL